MNDLEERVNSLEQWKLDLENAIISRRTTLHDPSLARQALPVIAIERGGQRIVNPNRHIVFQHDDLIWFVSPDELTLTGFEKKMVEI